MPIPLLGPLMLIGSTVVTTIGGIWFTKKYGEDVNKAIDNPEEAEKLADKAAEDAKKLAGKAAIEAAGAIDSTIDYVTNPDRALKDAKDAAAEAETLYQEYQKTGSLKALAEARFGQKPPADATPPVVLASANNGGDAPAVPPPAPPAPIVRQPEKPKEEEGSLVSWFKKQVMGIVPSFETKDALGLLGGAGGLGGLFAGVTKGNWSFAIIGGLLLTGALLYWMNSEPEPGPEPQMV